MNNIFDAVAELKNDELITLLKVLKCEKGKEFDIYHKSRGVTAEGKIKQGLEELVLNPQNAAAANK